MAASAAATTGGLLNLTPSHAPASSPILALFGTSYWRHSWRQTRLRPRRAPLLAASSVEAGEASYTEQEEVLLEALVGVQGRGRAVAPRQLQEVESAVQTLEALEGVPDPTKSSLIEGSWKLIFTTRPGTASPIQRTFVGVDSFKVFQEVYLRTDDPRVVNVVRFSETVGELAVQAEATIKDGKRILFRFDRAAFTFKFLPFKVPYPVPFRLLGDEAKGWLDTTYLCRGGNIRISRGNKGTTFVLQKSADPRQTLLSAISAGTGVKEVIDDLASSGKGVEADLKSLAGEWQLLWASQINMSSTVSASTTPASVPGKSRKDPAWEYAFVPSQKHPNNVGCNFCKSTYHGGITRLKQHLAGLRGQVSPCTQVPQDVRDKIKAMLEAAEEKKMSKEEELNKLRSQVHIAEENDGDEDQETTLARKRPLNKGPLDRYRETPEQARGKGKKKNETQTTLNAAYKLKEKERAYEYIADWFYQAGIPLNAIRLDSFDLMLEAVGQYGPGLKKASPYQLGTPLLEKRVRSLDEYILYFAASWWAAHGTDAKELRKLAIKILNLTCSSSACERNWSAFERVHSKRRTRLTQKILNSLVYVMFNKRLQWKYSQRNRDPLAIKFVDDEPANDWLEEEVSAEGLQHSNVAEEQDGESDCDVEQDEPSQGGGNEKKRGPTTSTSRRSKRARNMQPEEESSDEEEEDDRTIPIMDDSSSDDGENDAILHDEE